MRRRSTGSTSEEDPHTSSSEPSHLPPTGHGDKVNDARRRIEEPLGDGEHSRTRRKDNVPASSHSSPSGDVKHWDPKGTTPQPQTERKQSPMKLLAKDITPDSMVECRGKRRLQWRNPWATSSITLLATALAFIIMGVIVHSFTTRQLDPKGCEMSYMRPSFARFADFDTEHTRFASKYSLYLYREQLVDEDIRVKGVPVLFIPGNAGSYKQVRPIAAEAAVYYDQTLQHDKGAKAAGKRPLDFFSVDFNEDFTAFHGQTLLDQAEYLNDAVSFILSLYHSPSRSLRDPSLPDPSSVIIVGHSMGGIVARAMLTMSNYQSNSINTILTLSAPHARPPVSFDGEMVTTYERVNHYWRHAYSQKWAIDNPLWHVTLISIAGGGLDTVVPSDYANLASLVPDTHGFTVFTSSMPNVWTGMDHLAITWCDQVRKSIIRALYDVTDVSRPTQTLPRAERMRGFKKWFLTGLEDVAEKTLPHKEPKTLLTLEDNSNAIMSQGERLVLRSLGQSKQKPKAYLLPIPPQTGGKKFTFLTNEKLDSLGEYGKLEVLFCSVHPFQAGHSAALFSMNMDLSGDSTGSTRLACKNAATDVIPLPASTRQSTQPFKVKDHEEEPFSYLQYDLEELAEHQFVAIVDKAGEHSTGWAVAEFSAASDSVIPVKMGLQRLLTTGLSMRLPAKRPLVVDVKIPALYSSLLAYSLHVGKQACDTGEMFAPLLRQYITEVYESKFFVNVKDANINLHGVSPYMPPPFLAKSSTHGVSLQVWSDPTCDSSMQVSLKVDWLGSLGKLVMRYRIVFAAFPLLVVALVMRQQFRVYDETAIFMSFSESLNECLRSSIPVVFVGLTFLSVSIAGASYQASPSNKPWFAFWGAGNATDPFSYTNHELLLGSDDSFFWFLIPLFGLMSVGIVVVVNYAALGLTYIFVLLYSAALSFSRRNNDAKSTTSAGFASVSPRQRLISTGILLSLVSTVVPYHMVYAILCFIQIATCVRGYKIAKDLCLDANYNFYNYAHSTFILMLWILPINVPVLVVWTRNLAVHWLTPFSTHHNVISVLPFILLIETQSTGRMIPRLQSRTRFFTSLLLFFIALYAAIYGVTYAYRLHHLANLLSAWLVAVHLDISSFSLKKLSTALLTMDPDGSVKKRP
ncbi:GPI inositol-deacylase [Delitschia confertaspora ATCC 74209]|uniref:GPI inositol-deacylase n=1 Tax=Delitschia confertaspora ATCC 74209 TaxID=1513339 RepID=A0A9P4MQ51_9PLEO|nr:GPI inositol-deacylase [Delitschia confertaspora ATCC 74209]